MKYLHEVTNRQELVSQLVVDPSHPSWVYVHEAVMLARSCITVELDHETTGRLLLNSSPKMIGFVSAEQAVREVIEDPGFLATERDNGLNGKQVAYYLRQLQSQAECPHGLLVVEMHQGLQVRDGMHRLVAYGVFNNGFHAKDFPLSGYLCRS